MSALPPKADMDQHGRDVRCVPKADIPRCSTERHYSITSSARPSIASHSKSIQNWTPFAVRWSAHSAGRSGIHVVTGERARNVCFYEKNEFRLLATAHWNGADVVFMGRLLRPH